MNKIYDRRYDHEFKDGSKFNLEFIQDKDYARLIREGKGSLDRMDTNDYSAWLTFSNRMDTDYVAFNMEDLLRLEGEIKIMKAQFKYHHKCYKDILAEGEKSKEVVDDEIEKAKALLTAHGLR